MSMHILPTIDAIASHYACAPTSIFEPDSEHQGATVLALRNATVAAKPAAVFGPDAALLWAYSPQLQKSPENCDAKWRRPQKPARHLAGRTLYAVVDGFSYYHWLTGTLPKLLLAARAGYQLADFDHIVVNQRHKGLNFQSESLSLLGISLDKVIWIDRNLHLQCEEIVLPSEPCKDNQQTLAPWAIELLKDWFLPHAHRELPSVNIYISRALARRRRLINEDDLRRQLTRHAYETFILETMSFAQQIGLFSKAQSVVGLHGAGLSNLIWCQPETTVIEILPNTSPNPCFARLAKTCELDYHALSATGIDPKRGFASDSTVDLSALAKALQLKERNVE